MTVITALNPTLGISGIHEVTYEVTHFRRTLQPKGDRKKLLLQFFGHDASMKLHKADFDAGGRLHTVAADDVAEILLPPVALA